MRFHVLVYGEVYVSITVKKLIEQLQKIENPFAEVEVYAPKNYANHLEIECVRKVSKKVLIFIKDIGDKE